MNTETFSRTTIKTLCKTLYQTIIDRMVLQNQVLIAYWIGNMELCLNSLIIFQTLLLPIHINYILPLIGTIIYYFIIIIAVIILEMNALHISIFLYEKIKEMMDSKTEEETFEISDDDESEYSGNMEENEDNKNNQNNEDNEENKEYEKCEKCERCQNDNDDELVDGYSYIPLEKPSSEARVFKTYEEIPIEMIEEANNTKNTYLIKTMVKKSDLNDN